MGSDQDGPGQRLTHKTARVPRVTSYITVVKKRLTATSSATFCRGTTALPPRKGENSFTFYFTLCHTGGGGARKSGYSCIRTEIALQRPMFSSHARLSYTVQQHSGFNGYIVCHVPQGLLKGERIFFFHESIKLYPGMVYIYTLIGPEFDHQSQSSAIG